MSKKENPKPSKKRIVKDYDNLSPELSKQLHEAYPDGFVGVSISFFDRDGKRVSAIPFETEDIYYLIRWVEKKAKPAAKGEDDIDSDIDTDAAGGDDDIYDNGEGDEESGGDVSLDEIANVENSSSEDDNY